MLRARRNFITIFPAPPNKYNVFATRVRICLNETEVNVDYFSEGKSAGVQHVLMDDLDKGEDISVMEKVRNGDNSGIQKLNGGRIGWVGRR